MGIEHISYNCDGTALVGALVCDPADDPSRPLLLISTNWLGMTRENLKLAERLASDQYVAFVADMFGDGRTCEGPPEAAELADALRNDPTLRRRRITAALDTLTTLARARNLGNPGARAAVGFCLGGGNVLELARSGADVAAAISVHGDLTTKGAGAAAETLKSSILILHGSADPVADKSHRDAIEAELTAAGADWQMVIFGGALHSFTEPGADVPNIAKHDPDAAAQSFVAIDLFLKRTFSQRP